MHKAPLHWLFHCRASAVKALISSPSRTDPERRQAFHSRLWRQTSPRHSNKLLLVVNLSPYDNCIRRKKKKKKESSEAFAWLRLPVKHLCLVLNCRVLLAQALVMFSFFYSAKQRAIYKSKKNEASVAYCRCSPINGNILWLVWS